jgi:predicted CXXCH cytochrome family protein
VPARTSFPRVVALVALGGALVAALSCGRQRGARSAGPDEAADRVTENVLRRDYAGSQTCKPCHEKIYKQWTDSPMHRMTRLIDKTTIHAPFDGQVFRFMGDTARMETHHGARYVVLDSKHSGHRIYRVTKVIGGRYREDFVGIEVAGTGKYSGEVQSDERVMPVSWLVFDHAWRYKGYSVMTPERHGLRPGSVWRKTCIFCHNTEPYLDSTLDELYGPHSPGYQGSASIALPRNKRFRFEITDEEGLRDRLSDELHFLGAPRYRGSDKPQAWLAATMAQIRRHFGTKQLLEVGIGCEDCHGGSKQHADDPLHVKPSFAVRSDFMRVDTPDGRAPDHAQNINRACQRCHTVLFSRYPYTWEGGHRYGHPGGSGITSGEARDFLLGGCSTRMSCASCHDPHTRDPKSKLDALAGPAGTRLCTSCHDNLRGAAAITAHTHHPIESAGSQCINCHMPKKNMALDYELTRYHRIGSPTDRDRVERDRPLECALCHSDKSVASLVSTMERWWHKRYSRAALHRLYGPDLGENAILATLQFGKPHEQASALGVAGRDHLRAALPLMVDQLDNRYPLLRYFARASVQRLTGEPLPLDMSAPGRTLLAQGRAWLRAHDRASAQR